MALPPHGEQRHAPATQAATITPGASALGYTTRGIYVGGDGSITVTMAGGGSVQFVGCKAGTVLPIQATHVTAATATDLVGLY